MTGKGSKLKKLFIIIPVFIILTVVGVILSIRIKYELYENELNKRTPAFSEQAYYYNQLGYKEQLLYDALKGAFETLENETEIVPCIYDDKEFRRITKAIAFDCPELFYIDFSSLELYQDWYKSKVLFRYYVDKDDIPMMKMELEAAVASSVAYVTNDMSLYEKQIVLHDYLTNRCTYINDSDLTADFSFHTAYGALVGKTAFCDGYTSALKLIFNRVGIECITVDGKTGSELHAWNIAKNENGYAHIDVTWDDSDLDFAQELLFHGFFNLTDEDISATHTTEDLFTLPKCETPCNFYIYNDSVVHSKEDFDAICYRLVKESCSAEKPFIEVMAEYTTDGNDFKDQILEVIKKVNSEYGEAVLSESYRSFNTYTDSHSMTLQLYYINK